MPLFPYPYLQKVVEFTCYILEWNGIYLQKCDYVSAKKQLDIQRDKKTCFCPAGRALWEVGRALPATAVASAAMSGQSQRWRGRCEASIHTAESPLLACLGM